MKGQKFKILKFLEMVGWTFVACKGIDGLLPFDSIPKGIVVWFILFFS